MASKLSQIDSITFNAAGGIIGAEARTYAAKTANYTITSSDHIIDCTSGSFTVTLPTAVGMTGVGFVVKNSGAGVIQVATTSAQTIDGAADAYITAQYAQITLISDGANWKIAAAYTIGPQPSATYSHSATVDVDTVANRYAVPYDTVESEAGNVDQANSVVTITIATPGVVTWTAHGLAIGDVIVFSTTGALPTGLVAGTLYYVSTTSFGANSFVLSATSDGAIAGTGNIATSGTQSGTHTATAINVIVIPSPGLYSCAMSAIAGSGGNDAASLWFGLNGADLARSCTTVGVTGNGDVVIAVILNYAFVRGDKFRSYVSGDDNSVTFPAYPVAVSPTRPATPSFIFSILKVGR